MTNREQRNDLRGQEIFGTADKKKREKWVVLLDEN